MTSYDGTSKAKEGRAQSIPYHKVRTPYVEKLIHDAVAAASGEAIAFCDPDGYQGPEVECDAATLTQEEWLARRANTIGGSECAAIFGENPYKTNLEVYYEKIGQQPAIVEEETAQSRLNKSWGHQAEEHIKNWLSERYPYCKIFYDTNIYRHPDRPYVTANIDGVMQKPDGSYCLLEFKTASSFKKDEWADGNIPIQYVYQVRQYMGILGIWECLVVCLFDRDNIVANPITRDLDEEMRILEGLDEFWHGHVLAHIPPEPLGSVDGIIDTFRRYNGPVDKTRKNILLAADAFEDVCRRYTEAAQERSRIKKAAEEQDKRCKELSVSLIAALGTAVSGRVQSADGSTEYQIKYAPRKGQRKVDFDRLEALYPDAFAACVSQETEGSRVFSLKAVACR